MKNILLDYDGVLSELPESFTLFTTLAQTEGYKVYVVTMRGEDNPVELPDTMKDIDVIYTNEQAKIPFCRDLGIEFAIFIEDKPLGLYMDYATMQETQNSNHPKAKKE